VGSWGVGGGKLPHSIFAFCVYQHLALYLNNRKSHSPKDELYVLYLIGNAGSGKDSPNKYQCSFTLPMEIDKLEPSLPSTICTKFG
jgi:hypothetical protein